MLNDERNGRHMQHRTIQVHLSAFGLRDPIDLPNRGFECTSLYRIWNQNESPTNVPGKPIQWIMKSMAGGSDFHPGEERAEGIGGPRIDTSRSEEA